MKPKMSASGCIYCSHNKCIKCNGCDDNKPNCKQKMAADIVIQCCGEWKQNRMGLKASVLSCTGAGSKRIECWAENYIQHTEDGIRCTVNMGYVWLCSQCTSTRQHMYTFLLVTLVLSCAGSGIYGGLKFENHQFYLPHPHLMLPLSGETPQNFGMKLALEKLQVWGYCMVKILWS